jgi:hypothetical protein
MNIEQIRHALEELAKVRKQGGIRSRGIDKNIGEFVEEEPGPRHRVEVKITDPETYDDIQKFVRVKAKDKQDAIDKVEAYYDKKGIYIVNIKYLGVVDQGVAEGGEKYKVKSIGRDAKGDYYISPSTGKKVYKSGVKVGDHENPKTGEHKGVAEAGSPAQQAAIAIAKKKQKQADENLKTDNPCWKGYHPVGTKKKSGRTVPNCVPVSEDIENIMAVLIDRLIVNEAIQNNKRRS